MVFFSLNAANIANALNLIAARSAQESDVVASVMSAINSFSAEDQYAVLTLATQLVGGVSAVDAPIAQQLIVAASNLPSADYSALIAALNALPQGTRTAIVALAQQLATVNTS